MNIWFSRNLAFFLGIITPLLETIRRWHTWMDDPPAFFDDYILGGLLLFGAWRVSKNAESGQKFLAAGWGFMCGMAYYSFFSQLVRIRTGQIDPAPVSSEWVAVIKGIGFALAIIGLLTSLRKVSIEK
jgi:hypothetical protein